MICVTLVLVLSAPAFAQNGTDTDARLKRLENELETLNHAVYRGEMMPPPSTLFDADEEDAAGRAQIELRFGQIEGEVRNLTGRVEEQSYETRQLQEKLTQALQRIETLEASKAAAVSTPNNGAPIMTGSTNNTPSTTYDDEYYDDANSVSSNTLTQNDMVVPDSDMPSPPINKLPDSAKPMGQLSVTEGASGDATYSAVSLNEGPAAEYEQAFALLKDNNYVAAQASFETFLKKYPDHVLSANAMYWLGETFYVRNDFDQATRTFAEAYQKYPDGPKGPDNLLKLALSLAGKGDKDSACLTFTQLNRQYPSGNSPVLNRAEQEKTKLGCK